MLMNAWVFLMGDACYISLINLDPLVSPCGNRNNFINLKSYKGDPLLQTLFAMEFFLGECEKLRASKQEHCKQYPLNIYHQRERQNYSSGIM